MNKSRSKANIPKPIKYGFKSNPLLLVALFFGFFSVVNCLIFSIFLKITTNVPWLGAVGDLVSQMY